MKIKNVNPLYSVIFLVWHFLCANMSKARRSFCFFSYGIILFSVGASPLLMAETLMVVSPPELSSSPDLRDPTTPLYFSPKTPLPKQKTALLLQAVFYGTENRGNKDKKAVINGRSYLEGEWIGDVKIKKIHRQSVVCEDNGQTFTLYLRSNIFSRP